MDRVDATLRNIDAAIAVSEKQSEHTRTLLAPPRGARERTPDALERFWGRLMWLLCLRWL